MHGTVSFTDSSTHTPQVTQPGVRILIVEDGLIVAEDIRRRCESVGYRVSGIASSGEDAVVLAEQTRPDVILMDIRLRGTIDGIEAASRIRCKLNIPVVYATAYSDDATLNRAKLTNPSGYLLKPVEARELRAAIELALHRKLNENGFFSSSDRYQALINAFPDAVLLLRPSGVIAAANDLAVQRLGSTGIVGKSLLDFVPPDDRSAVLQAITSVTLDGVPREAHCTLLDMASQRSPSTIFIRPVADAGTPAQVILAVAKDAGSASQPRIAGTGA